MKNFEFEKYRDDLAEKLKGTRAEVGGKAKDELIEAQKTESYQTSKKLHQVARAFSQEDLNAATRREEVDDDPEKWDVEDVSDKTSQKYKLWIDVGILHKMNIKTNYDDDTKKETRHKIDHLISEALEPKEDIESGSVREYEKDVERGKTRTEINDFLDEITDGRYLDGHNFNHSILGQPFQKSVRKHVGVPFDRYSKIIPSHETTSRKSGGGFWVSACASYYNSVDNPIIIMSPNNPEMRHFIENELYPPIQELMDKYKKDVSMSNNDAERLKKCVKFDKTEFVGFRLNGSEDLARLLFLAGQPFATDYSRTLHSNTPLQFHFGVPGKYDPEIGTEKLSTTWMEISDCIIDLPAGKVWKRKYSDEEMAQVKQDQEKYKKWIEDNILHRSFDKLIQV